MQITRVHYEDLAADPATEMARIFNFIGANNRSNFELHDVGLPLNKSTATLRTTIHNVDQVETALQGTKWIEELDLPLFDGGD